LTSAALADRLEVATRTVKRDITALQEAGVPIAASGGPEGGYVLDAAATLPPVTFTVGEAVAVAVAMSTRPGQPFAADGRRALTKLLGVVPPDALDRAETLAGRVWVRGAEAAEPDRRTAQRVVEEAVRTATVVLIDYVDRNGATSIRRPVDPLGLAHDRGTSFLLAWCRQKDDGRWFRLDRITAAHPTNEPATPRDVTSAFGVPPADVGPVTLT
jgi:predicted DNA-binding transcriptional regulator YafY